MNTNILQCYFFDPDGLNTQIATNYFQSIGLHFEGQDQRLWIELQHYPKVLSDVENAKYFGNRHKAECFHALTKISDSGLTIYVTGQNKRQAFDMSVFISSKNIISIHDSEFRASFIISPEETRELYGERKKRLKEKSVALEREAANFAFEDWEHGLSLEQKEQIYPVVMPRNAGVGLRIDSLRRHFHKHVWPERHLEIEQGRG